MVNIGLPEIILTLLIPAVLLWVIIYTAVRTAIRHSDNSRTR
ncbi:hypothetical protein Nocox_22790 [Nonomuraea coxensis DSM 45129]|uniref:Uncharacterized protein n=1 Tax=Nonomuraea coxensis DSM 45129 TaxID=1122611 RepID=A0ABX8U696_9ACTN|nr:hypothetical protein [Nonomuraea coxensis]QYC42162.1 hypothetical protein Nocox_22790 [Nonomuraea coxensis DSM 45129]